MWGAPSALESSGVAFPCQSEITVHAVSSELGSLKAMGKIGCKGGPTGPSNGI